MNERQKEAFLKIADKAINLQHTQNDEAKKVLEPLLDVPVSVSVVVGKVVLPISDLLRMNTGSVLELDKKIGENVDIYVNDKMIAKGELVSQGDHLGVSLCEFVGK